ncbi:hypothetical protein [Mycobacterium sp.]|uniref:hypothetical protein n=1 Tax=Mycobacterium sp. TaxID=1785 RepID=UPI002CFACE5C|nr:hypothetical protein [Mycobacterium sp.]HTY35374.1 hypothetical protein [Mycobacterium sp.]
MTTTAAAIVTVATITLAGAIVLARLLRDLRDLHHQIDPDHTRHAWHDMSHGHALENR